MKNIGWDKFLFGIAILAAICGIYMILQKKYFLGINSICAFIVINHLRNWIKTRKKNSG